MTDEQWLRASARSYARLFQAIFGESVRGIGWVKLKLHHVERFDGPRTFEERAAERAQREAEAAQRFPHVYKQEDQHGTGSIIFPRCVLIRRKYRSRRNEHRSSLPANHRMAYLRGRGDEIIFEEHPHNLEAAMANPKTVNDERIQQELKRHEAQQKDKNDAMVAQFALEQPWHVLFDFGLVGLVPPPAAEPSFETNLTEALVGWKCWKVSGDRIYLHM